MKEIPKAYSPKEVEKCWRSFWEASDFFKANPKSKKPPYCIVLPPPNVTGALHMGHALVDTLQDVLIRWKRMLGLEVLWVPGLDHAGISTQTVVERHLIATEGKRRKDYEREEFLDHVWKWKEDHQERIIHQLKQLGCSCDWSRLRFTMDEGASHAVRSTFKKMFDAGLIYRGDYLVNWDPVTQTALADDEVEYEEHDSCLWHFRYPLADSNESLIVATTRPETMLGDTAVAVSPKDPRFSEMVGKEVLLPITKRRIPIIADHYVDPEFGSGVVKITPAHDPNDYEIGMRHELPFINVMTPDGKINEEGGEFEGIRMIDARSAVVQRMKELGFLEKIEPYKHRVGVSYRSKAIIEPYLSKQWFVKMSAFKEQLKKAVEKKRVKLIPENWENTYFHWIDNLRDWCISRQLWWGHRIPIWYNAKDPEKIICHAGDGLPPEVEADPEMWRQDEDVLDTWFSSALWPFSTLGWPEKTDDFERFYPNATLVTGHDILFFWVARMIFMGEYITGEVPFAETFLHGLIYGKSYWRKDIQGHIHYVSHDEKKAFDLGEELPKDVDSRWEKMSKSKGNVIDPIEIIDEYGADAMRLALCASATHARQIDLDRRRFEEFKNFANKLWNGARFVFMNLEDLTSNHFADGLNMSLLSLEDRWILSLLNRTNREVNEHLSRYEFDHATTKTYEFFWDKFCAYYLEIVKPTLFGKVGTEEERANKQKILVIVLLNALRMMHPFAPYITEELFQRLKEHLAHVSPTKVDPYTIDAIQALLQPTCALASYPTLVSEKDIDKEIEEGFACVDRVVYALRNIRAEMQIPPSLATDVMVVAKEGFEARKLLEENLAILRSLVRTEQIYFLESEKAISALQATAIVDGLKLIVPLPKALEEKEKARLTKEKEKLEKQIANAKGKLANEAFLANAPKELVEEAKKRLEESQQKLDDIETKLATMR